MKDSPATPSRTFRETEGDSPAAYFVTGTFAFSSSNHPADRGMDSMTTLLVATTGMSGPIRPRRDVKELLGPPQGWRGTTRWSCRYSRAMRSQGS